MSHPGTKPGLHPAVPTAPKVSPTSTWATCCQPPSCQGRASSVPAQRDEGCEGTAWLQQQGGGQRWEWRRQL